MLSIAAIGLSSVRVQAREYGDSRFLVAPALFYYSNLRERSSKEEKSYTMYELKIGGAISSEIFLGLSYQGEQGETKNSGYSSAALNNSSKDQRTSYGPFIGYITPTFHSAFTYYYLSQWDLNTTTSTGSTKYKYTGSGMQFDIGYKIQLGGIFFGPQLSYKIFTYKKLSTDDGAEASISPALKDSAIEPSIVLYWFF